MGSRTFLGVVGLLCCSRMFYCNEFNANLTRSPFSLCPKHFPGLLVVDPGSLLFPICFSFGRKISDFWR